MALWVWSCHGIEIKVTRLCGDERRCCLFYEVKSKLCYTCYEPKVPCILLTFLFHTCLRHFYSGLACLGLFQCPCLIYVIIISLFTHLVVVYRNTYRMVSSCYSSCYLILEYLKSSDLYTLFGIIASIIAKCLATTQLH